MKLHKEQLGASSISGKGMGALKNYGNVFLMVYLYLHKLLICKVHHLRCRLFENAKKNTLY